MYLTFQKLLFLFILFIIFFICFNLSAQNSLLEFNFAGNSGNETTENSTLNSTNILPAIITKSGISSAGNSDRFGGSGFPQTNALNVNNFIEVIMKPVSGCDLTVTGITAYLHRSNTGPKNMVVRSSLDNFTTNLGNAVTVPTSVNTVNFTFSITNSTPITFRFYFYNASAGTGTGGFDNSGATSNPTLVFLGSTNCDTTTPSVGSLNIDNLITTSFSVNCNSSAVSSQLTYNTDVTYLANNSFRVELSSPTGTFPGSQIGILYGFQQTGQIAFDIPANSPTGTYKLRIKSLNPNITSLERTITITQTGNCQPVPPHITSLLYDGCNSNSACDEGQSEIAFGNTGTNSFLVTNSNISFKYEEGAPYDLLNNLVNSSSKVNQMNVSAGCDGLFVNAFGLTVPPNTPFLLVSESICDDVFIWSDLCDLGPIYVIFGKESTSTGWKPGGNFGNSGSSKKFSLTIKNTNGVSSTMNYLYNSNGSGDGRYATYPTEGIDASNSSRITPATNGTFTNCRMKPEALSMRLINFENVKIHDDLFITWRIKESREIKQYLVDLYNEKTDSWISCGTISAFGSEEIETYNLANVEYTEGNNIYRLSTRDFEGEIHTEGFTNYFSQSDAFFQKGNKIANPQKRDFSIFSVDGKVIPYTIEGEHIYLTHKGLIFLVDKEGQKSYRFFLP